VVGIRLGDRLFSDLFGATARTYQPGRGHADHDGQHHPDRRGARRRSGTPSPSVRAEYVGHTRRVQFDVTIEIPKGQRNKYEVDHRTGRSASTACSSPLRVSGRLRLYRRTLGQDGDPLDALVLLEEPTFPGCLILCRAIGMFRMTDEKGPDDKVIALPASDPRVAHLQDIDDIPPFDRLEIQHFFEVYKDLEPGKSVEGASWVGRLDAEKEIDLSRARLAAAEH